MTLESQSQLQQQQMIVAQFQDHEGKLVGPPLNLPVSTTPEQLDQLINQILENVKGDYSRYSLSWFFIRMKFFLIVSWLMMGKY